LIVIVFINFINYIKKQGIFLKKGLIFAALVTAHFQQVIYRECEDEEFSEQIGGEDEEDEEGHWRAEVENTLERVS
jgi:hypothetical protein